MADRIMADLVRERRLFIVNKKYVCKEASLKVVFAMN